MSWLSSLLGGAFDFGISISNQDMQKIENEKDRAFNAEQAQLNRDFQSKEAEAAFEREVEFYEQYQSIGAQMQQMKDNGLNPALMYGGAPSVGSSTPASAAPSGSVASSSGSSLPQIAAVSKEVFDLKAMKENINLLREDVKLKREQAEKERIENKYREERQKVGLEIERATAGLTWTRIEEVKKSIEVHENSIAVGNSVIEVNASQATLNAAKTAMENLQMDNIEEMQPLLVEYQMAKNENERQDTAVKIAQKAGIEAQTSRTETGESLDVAGEVREGVVDTVTTGVLIADFIGEVIGVEDMGQRWTETREVRDKKGNKIGETKTTRETTGRKSKKKKRRRR